MPEARPEVHEVGGGRLGCDGKRRNMTDLVIWARLDRWAKILKSVFWAKVYDSS